MVSSRPPDTAHVAKEETSVENNRCITELSLHSLRVELRRRNLSTIGLRPALECRLALDLTSNRSISRARRYSSTPKRLKHGAIRRNLRTPRGTISVPPRFPDADMPCSTLPLHFQQDSPNRFGLLIGRISGSQNHASTDPSGKSNFCFSGVLRGQSVWIMGQEQMNAFWEAAGPCGKANLSRSAPSYNVPQDTPTSALKGRAMRQLLALEENEAPAHSFRHQRANTEHLQLTLVEAYYSSFIAKCLVLKDSNSKILNDPIATWSTFCDRSQRFPLLFVAYCRYRSARWIPRSGVKYGVDWVLYPAATKKHSHAPYCVILRFATNSETAQIDRSWIRLQNRLRLVKNVAKTLVIATITLKQNVDVTKSFETAFRMADVSEITVDRWIP